MHFKPRRFFQFSLRTLLILITVLCLGPGGFIAYKQAKARRQRGAVAAIERMGGYIFYDEKAAVRTGLWRIILGDDTCAHVIGVDFNPLKTENRQIVDADLKNLRQLPGLSHLVLKNCPNISTAGLAELDSLANL